MGQTRYFGLAYFDFGDRLDAKINVDKEIDRFVLIDKQLYGLYNIFGNGVINGWYVRDAGYQDLNGITVSVDDGLGIVSLMACQTTEAGYVYNLPPNSIVNVYATVAGDTTADRSTYFVYSATPLSPTNYVMLARVATGANSILFIDNTIRDEVSFNEIIQDAVDEHKHRGTPSKIDLELETKNQLPGARIESIDASKITSGTFNISRIPLIDHNNLTNNGMLTHAALDSFVSTLSRSNKELLGEISTTNLLKMITFLKYLYPDIDQNFVNELVIIPGISPNSFIDFDASTANINLVQGCISGKPAKTGVYTSVYWNNTYAFNTYYVKDDVIIEDDTVSIERSSEATDVVSNFSDDLCFSTEMVVSDNRMACTIANDETGNKMASMGGGASLTYYYRKNLEEAKDWDGHYDELVIKVKTTQQTHAPVYMYLVNGSHKNSSNEDSTIENGDIAGVMKPTSAWVLLSEDESMTSFTEKVFDISTLGLNEVTQVTIYTTDDFVFNIDDIYARKTNMYAERGIVRYRYQTSADVVFHSLFYEATTPEDTSMSIRMKIANSSDLLSRASYSLPITSGDIFAITGSAVEIEVYMLSDSEHSVSPSLESIELRMLVDSDFSGFVIDTEEEWDRGTLTNISTQDGSVVGKSDLVMSDPINVGGKYFLKNGSVSEINEYKVGVQDYGFSGSNMPISPNQAREWSSTSSRGFDGPTSVIRKFGKTYLIADTNNNRVLEVDNYGNLIKGVGSTYSVDTSHFYPLSAVYSPTREVLTIVFSQQTTVSDITKISIYVGASKISLTSDCTVSTNRKAEGKIVEITLDENISARLVGITSDMYVNFDSGALAGTISIPSGMSSTGNSIYVISPLRGITCFVGEFSYVDNIRHPVFATESENGNWIIANSSIYYKAIDASKEKVETVTDVIEVDPDNPDDNEDMLKSSEIKFSDFTLGGIYEYEENKFLAAGLQSSTSTIPGISGSDLLAEYGENPPESVKFRAAAVDALKDYKGIVAILDKINNRQQVFYISPDGIYPTDIDAYSNGDFLISESSFADSSGRLIRLDSFGNVNWMYGSGTFNIINDAKVLEDDNILISV